MTSLQYSKKRRVPALSLPKLTKAARNFPTGLGLRVPISRLLISTTCLVSAVAVGWGTRVLISALHPSRWRPACLSLHHMALRPLLLLFSTSFFQKSASGPGKVVKHCVGAKPKHGYLKQILFFNWKTFKFFPPQFIFRTMVKHTNPGGLKHFPAVLLT